MIGGVIPKAALRKLGRDFDSKIAKFIGQIRSSMLAVGNRSSSLSLRLVAIVSIGRTLIVEES